MQKILDVILTAFIGGLFGLVFKLLEEPIRKYFQKLFSKPAGPLPAIREERSHGWLPYAVWGLVGMGMGMTLALLWGRIPPSASPSATPVGLPNVTPWKQDETLYQTGFDNAQAEEWRQVNDGNWETWQVGGNWVYGVRNQPPQYLLTSFLEPSNNWQDYGVEMQFMFQTGQLEQTWITLRTGAADCTGYNFGGNRYGLTLARFDPRQGCASTELGSVPDYPLVSNRLYTLRMEILGNEIRCYLDNQLVIRATDNVYPKGGLAMASYQVEWGWFDNIRAYSVSR